MKVFFRRIHLWLSFAAGLVILTCCLTGAILVFEKDLEMAFHKERYFVTQSGTPLTTEALLQKAAAVHPELKPTGVKWYNDATRSVELNAGREGTLYMNPYTGAVLERYSYRETFFYQVFALHRWLLGGQDSIGKLITGVATFIFLFIILTGIILWWPKTRRVLQQRLRIKSGRGWKRLNHDLHIVLGFYSAIFLFIFAFTGLAWSFEWFNKGIYTVTGSPMKPASPPKAAYAAGAQPVGPDAALATARKVKPGAQFYNLALPKDSTEVYTVQALPARPAHESATDAVYVDPYSGAVAGTLDFGQRNLGARTRSFFKPVHTGSLWGMPSKILAFIVCLLGVSFPVTGTIMWWNRTRKRQASGLRRETAVVNRQS